MLRTAVVTWFLFHYFHISFAQVSDDILNLCIRLFVHLLNLERWTGDSLLFHYPLPVQAKRGPRVLTVIWTRRPKSHRENLHLFDLPSLIVCLGTCRISSREIFFELDPASLDSSFFLFVFIYLQDSRFSLLYTVWYSTPVICVTRALINPRCRVGRHSRVESHAQEGGEKVKEGNKKEGRK